MSSRNNSRIEDSPLNLSLTGSQMNGSGSSHSRINIGNKASINKKPPAPATHSYRSFISSSSSNLPQQVEASSQNKQKSSIVNGADSLSSRSISKQQTPRSLKHSAANPYLIKKTNEKENQETSRKTKESFVFKPLSVRSSTESDFGQAKTLNESKISKMNTDLDFFFDLVHSGGLSKNQQDNSFKLDDDSSDLSNAIKPLNENSKIKEIKSSVENLRRELEEETLKNEQENVIKKQIEQTKQKLAAIKIQKWYRRIRQHKLKNNRKEMEIMFNRKKMEMRKKLASDLEKASILNNRGKQQTVKTNARTLRQSTHLTENKQNPKVMVSKSNEMDIKEKEEKPHQFKQEDQESKITVNKHSLNNESSTQSTTIESILSSLDKIDKESQNLLSLPKTVDESNDKINSILSYLDEAAASNSNSFVPRTFKESIYEDFSQTSETTTTKPSKNYTSSSSPSISSSSSPQTPKQQQTATKKDNKKVNSSYMAQETGQEDDGQQTDRSTKTKPFKKTTKPETKPMTRHQKEVDEELQRLKEESISSASNVELNNSILMQKLEIEEKKRTIAMLEKALVQQRELTIRHTKEADKEMQVRLESQKNDYEATIQRHLGFIDQLIDDKKTLSEKCEKLLKELKDVEKSYSDRLRASEERLKFETQKLKDTFEAAEKLRREKWIEEKTKKIKEMTVKGLEPEIQSLITKHKNEIKTLKSIHDAELLQADERAAQRYIRITEELRENYEREKESSIQKEREICKQRYEKSLEEEEKSFLEQRRRLYAEIEEEKNRIAEQGAMQRKELDRLRKMLEENNYNSIETIRKEYMTSQVELEKKHQVEIESLKETLKIEKESWEQNYMKKQENWIIQKERELKDQVKRDRDKEIELLIQRLEAESTSAREEADRASENRIKRIRDKYESELREVEKTERETMERYNVLKSKYNELESEHERLKVICRQKEKDLEGIKKLTDTLQDERNRLADVIRQDFTDRIIFTEEENKRIKLDMAELKSRHQLDLDKKKEEFEKLQKEKADELNTVHEKIKNVLAKKDETFNQLKQQYEAASKRADHLEGLLEQQRTLMIKKQAN